MARWLSPLWCGHSSFIYFPTVCRLATFVYLSTVHDGLFVTFFGTPSVCYILQVSPTRVVAGRVFFFAVEIEWLKLLLYWSIGDGRAAARPSRSGPRIGVGLELFSCNKDASLPLPLFQDCMGVGNVQGVSGFFSPLTRLNGLQR